jgi:beta-barrel assembly-enhancing protease
MRTRHFIFVAAAMLGAAGAAPAQFGGLDKLKKGFDTVKDNAGDLGKVAKGVAGLSIEEEQQIGDSVALEILAKYGGAWRDEEATKRVNLIGSALARYSDRPGLEWRFAILDSDTINAFSAPGGFVFITRGLYAELEDDDALAAVLSHEIAHITRKHALLSIRRAEVLGGATSFLSRRSTDVRETEQKLQMFQVGIDDITKTLFEKGFDPKMEYDADAKGRELAVTNGYAPGALRKVLTRLEQKKAAPEKLFSTHPPLKSRLEKLPKD